MTYNWRIFQQLNVPVNQNLVYQNEQLAQNAVVGDLDICCDDTGFMYNRAFDNGKVDYSSKYDNNQYHSLFFRTYIDSQIEWLVKKYISINAKIVEVGCGKGFYLKKIAQELPMCKAYGFDTSYEWDGEANPSNLVFYQEYYNEAFEYLKPNIVISRHVIEHISEPVEFLLQIRKTMEDGAILFLETPDIEWILRNNVIFDFFYEHCSYWSKDSLDQALRLSGFETIETSKQFDGQYLWIVAKAIKKDIAAKKYDTEKFLSLCQQFAGNREKEIHKVTQALQFLNEKGTIAVWGAGAKGVTFVNLFDPGKHIISCIIDINPAKQSKYIGKTGHEIVSPNEFGMKFAGGGDHCVKFCLFT